MKFKTANKTVKRADSNRTKASKLLTIERKNIRLNIMKNGGRF
jgi:hypothetical protein